MTNIGNMYGPNFTFLGIPACDLERLSLQLFDPYILGLCMKILGFQNQLSIYCQGLTFEVRKALPLPSQVKGLNISWVTIPRAEQLRIIQRVYAKWSEVYDDRDDVEANDAYEKMLDEAMAEAEDRHKDRST